MPTDQVRGLKAHGSSPAKGSRGWFGLIEYCSNHRAGGQLQPPYGAGPSHTKSERRLAVLHILLVVVLVLVLLSFFGGYSGFVPSHFGYGGGGVGLVVLVVLLVLLFR
jgi:hypothetical protein